MPAALIHFIPVSSIWFAGQLPNVPFLRLYHNAGSSLAKTGLFQQKSWLKLCRILSGAAYFQGIWGIKKTCRFFKKIDDYSAYISYYIYTIMLEFPKLEYPC